MKVSTNINPRVMQFIGALLTLGCLGLVAFGIYATILGIQTQSWPTAEGIILQSSSRRGGNSYYVDLQYRYSVNDQSYVGTNITPSASVAMSTFAANDLVRGRYAVGKSVKVYYDPHNPQNAVLQPGVIEGTGLMIVFGLIFAVCGVVIVIFAPKGARPRPIDV